MSVTESVIELYGRVGADGQCDINSKDSYFLFPGKYFRCVKQPDMSVDIDSSLT